MRSRLLCYAIGAAALLALPLPATAQQPYAQGAAQYGFVGAHPIPYDQGSGFCPANGAHFHNYAPFDKYLFRESGGYFYFIGDASDFGYSQQTWGYRGHHPIPVGYGGGYCYISWGHRHLYSPPMGAAYNLNGGYYVYGGTWDPLYYRYRSYYAPYYSGYYRTTYYGNRYYTVRPPVVYAPRIAVGAPGVYRPGAVVVGPGGGRVTVSAPPARVGVSVSAPPPRATYSAPRSYAPVARSAPAVRVSAPSGRRR